MDWRSQLGGKLTSVQEAVQAVKSGDIVGVSPFTCTPFTLCDALYERRGELHDVHIQHPGVSLRLAAARRGEGLHRP